MDKTQDLYFDTKTCEYSTKLDQNNSNQIYVGSGTKRECENRAMASWEDLSGDEQEARVNHWNDQ